jgi:hypothetical protein
VSHKVIIMSDSLLEIFDPTKTEYAGVRDHYTVQELEKLDELRLRAHPISYTLLERIFMMAMIDRAILLAENES